MQKSAKQVRIKKVEIATPCSVPWSSMSGDQAVRFCGKCSKNVYNVSEMHELDLLEMIKQKEGKVCLRVFRRRDGTIITKDCPVGRFALGLRQAIVGLVALLGGLAAPGIIDWLASSSRQGNFFCMTIQDGHRTESVEMNALDSRYAGSLTHVNMVESAESKPWVGRTPSG